MLNYLVFVGIKNMDFFGDLKEVYISINIVTNKGITLTRNFDDVFQLADHLRENPHLARAVRYGEKKKKK